MPPLHFTLAPPSLTLLISCFLLNKNKKIRHFCTGSIPPSPPSQGSLLIHSRGCKGSPFTPIPWGLLLFLVTAPQTAPQKPQPYSEHTSWLSPPPSPPQLKTKLSSFNQGSFHTPLLPLHAGFIKTVSLPSSRPTQPGLCCSLPSLCFESWPISASDPGSSRKK